MINSTLGIDQSLKGTAQCLLDDNSPTAKPVVLETFVYDDKSKVVGMQRLQEIVGRLMATVDEHDPQLIVMEDYAMSGGMGTNNLTRLAELGGIIRWEAAKRGYVMGYGTGRNATEREQAWEATQKAERLFVLQTSGMMKSFCLGNGSTKKDPRYLLTVQEKLHRSFDNDNEADAYMHANMASILVGVVRGVVPISNLTDEQQESLLDKGRKLRKGLSLRQALRLPDEEKLELIRL